MSTVDVDSFFFPFLLFFLCFLLLPRSHLFSIPYHDFNFPPSYPPSNYEFMAYLLLPFLSPLLEYKEMDYNPNEQFDDDDVDVGAGEVQDTGGFAPGMSTSIKQRRRIRAALYRFSIICYS